MKYESDSVFLLLLLEKAEHKHICTHLNCQLLECSVSTKAAAETDFCRTFARRRAGEGLFLGGSTAKLLLNTKVREKR